MSYKINYQYILKLLKNPIKIYKLAFIAPPPPQQNAI